ncbi:LacI family DNA-binding transcriptional regulator [Microbacterium halotolerans]|uniref:LacI family DNA-binding transcriptional regulator n=1 Tax=Microbacterium halotolerans TaxID=246613 RepID=UPI000E6ABFD5|nr:LacI family DNA-binding transcriptional regulator [Microbacterium halotolerans]
MSTMQDVASHAGVSAKTVSRVFNADPHVRPETRDRVERAMRETGYVPNVLARTFRHGRSQSVGVAIPDVGDPFFAAIVRAVETVCAPAGVTTLVASIGDDPERERDVIEALLKAQLMGLILAPVAQDQSWLEPWLEHTPIEFVDRPAQGVEAEELREDDLDGARRAVEHLVSRGHRRIAFLADSVHPPSTQRRRDGWRLGLRDAGIEPTDVAAHATDDSDHPRHELVSIEATDPESAAAAIARMRALPDPPTAAVTANARVTMRAFESLKHGGWAFVGIGDFPMAHALTPAVTVMAQDPAELGRRAAERALERFESPAEPAREHPLIPMHLTVRDSTPAPRRAYPL